MAVEVITSKIEVKGAMLVESMKILHILPSYTLLILLPQMPLPPATKQKNKKINIYFFKKTIENRKLLLLIRITLVFILQSTLKKIELRPFLL
jgi:hypothetical protein